MPVEVREYKTIKRVSAADAVELQVTFLLQRKKDQSQKSDKKNDG